MSETDILTAAEAARLLKVSTRTLHRLRHREWHPIPFLQIGWQVRFVVGDIERWAREEGGPEPPGRAGEVRGPPRPGGARGPSDAGAPGGGAPGNGTRGIKEPGNGSEGKRGRGRPDGGGTW